MSRFVLDSNNLWLFAINDNTIRVLNGPYSPDLNTHDVPKNVNNWKTAARIGSNSHCTHREMEIFGVVFNAPKLQALNKALGSNRAIVNREGFMVEWFNASGNRIPNASSINRRLNDLFDWSKHGVQVPTPVGTEWDRYQYNTGKLMVGGGGGGSAEEKEKENQRLQAEKDKEIEELKKQAKEKEEQQAAKDKEMEEMKKQAKEKEEQQAKEMEELKKQAKEKEEQQAKEVEELKKQAKEKDDQLAAKDKQISNLRSALGAFT